jgi:hypothetical protein
MSTSAIVGIIIAVVAIAIIAAATGRILVQRRELRERYGDEYQRVVTEKGGRAAAEAELKRREREHEKLELKELSPEVRDRYRSSWTELQSQFVDDPKAAVHAADQLVSELVAERGYPVVDYSDRLAHLSVEHASVLNVYRSAHDISVRNDAGTATTEDLRQALVSYRELIADLLGDSPLVDSSTTSTTDSDPALAAPADTSTADPAAVDATAVDTAAVDDTAAVADDTDVDDTDIDDAAVDDTEINGSDVDDTAVDAADTEAPAVVSPPASENPAPATPEELRARPADPDLNEVPESVTTPAAPARDND